MRMIIVKSKSVSQFGYDLEIKKLRIVYHNGNAYDYLNVSKAIAIKLWLEIDSIGQFVNEVIKPKYEVVKVRKSKR